MKNKKHITIAVLAAIVIAAVIVIPVLSSVLG